MGNRESKNNLYLSNGYVNAERIFESPSPIVVCFGGRGIGKTYGCLLYMYQHNIPFVYMRRTQSQLDAVTIQALNPFNQVGIDNGFCVVSQKMGKYPVGFFNGDVSEDGIAHPRGNPIGIGIALNTFASIRGLSAESYTHLLFDEFVEESHQRKLIKHEDTAFLNAYESLNRNRENLGKPPMKIILLSNTNTINSQILDALDCTMDVNKMIKKGQEVRVIKNGDIELIRYLDSPISSQKRKNLIYRVTQNADFTAMALDNDFSAADFEHIKTLPLQEFNMVVSIGELTCCAHKSKNQYYIISGKKAKNRLANTPLELKEFRKRYYYLYRAMITGSLYYSDVHTKIEFEKIWE